ncbi:MAG TPA: type II and III secretion system protein family protein [Alphaproteobacteria bacterium]|nr:type II and III secretion system protein family protein [Alphaproteobacteria bacterium]
MFRMLKYAILGLAIGTASVLGAGSAEAQTQPQIQAQDFQHAGEFHVPLNKSQILRIDRPFSDLLVGNAEVADVLALTNRSIYVLGKAPGSTNLTIYGPGKQLIAVVDLVVGFDVEGLKAKLHEIMPDEPIEVRAVNDAIALSGRISTATHLSQALAVAESFAPEKVNNFLTVVGSQQVMLQVRFAEVTRSTAKALALSTEVLFDDGNDSFLIETGRGINNFTEVVDPFVSSLLSLSIGDLDLNLLFDALEDKGLVKTLAEPTLIALSGDTASFLAGGEFPVPVAQSSSTSAVGGVSVITPVITVEFKEFGVGLSFTPTVLGDGLINLAVKPEVSAIDTSPDRSVTVSGFRIPALTTRRASTTVELRDGESFAIAGLLQNDFADQIRAFPWLGDLPILGTLFRSTAYQRQETELVIVVTPRLVKPARAGELAAPTDRFVAPTEADLFLMGRTEDPTSGTEAAGPMGGGAAGTYGHIIQ